MCNNRQLIHNPHDGRHYWVKCGRCDSCLQEKADAHCARIKRELNFNCGNGVVGSFFVTLTYANEHLPFVRHSELVRFFEAVVRYKKCKNPTKLEYPTLDIYRNPYNPVAIGFYSMKDFEHLKREERFDFESYLNLIKYLPYARKKVGRNKFVHLNDVLSIIYQRDIQNFFKLLKINLFRAGYDKFFSYTYASELGEEFLRAHFHALINYDRRYESLVRDCIIKSWKHSNLSRRFKDETGHYRPSVEVARNPASYVSEYINLKSIIPQVYRDSKCFCPKIKFSQGFGLHFKYFTKEEICKMFYRGDLQYPCRQTINGSITERNVQVPKYVLLKYFPKCKGFNRLSSDEIFSILKEPGLLYEERFYKTMRLYPEDIPKIETQILNKRKEWCEIKGFKGIDLIIKCAQDISEFAFIGSRIWSLFASQCIKKSYEDVTCEFDLFEHFDNISDYLNGSVRHEILDRIYDSRLTYASDPNDFKLNRWEEIWLKDKFAKAIKRHRCKGMYYNKTHE